MYQFIKLLVENEIGIIKINCPETANAINPWVYAEIKDAVCHCTIREDIKVLILTGEGKHFSAGGDINEFKELIDSETYIEEKSIQLAGDTAEAVRKCKKPVIAMINGVAAGAGASLSLACDFRVMEPDSSLCMAFINMGLPGDAGGIYYLQKIIGIARTTELIMLGKTVKGKKAYHLGLVTRLAPKGKLLETTMELAEKLASQPMFAIAKQKEMLLQFFYKDISEFKEMERKCMMECSKSEDFSEAVNAFLEKRKPIFQGK